MFARVVTAWRACAQPARTFTFLPCDAAAQRRSEGVGRFSRGSFLVQYGVRASGWGSPRGRPLTFLSVASVALRAQIA
eukprot:8388822-Pyramimonas_sp.AAC.1